MNREIVELLAEGSTIEDLVRAAKEIPEEYYRPFAESSFRFEVDDYQKKIVQTDRVTLINRFSFMPLKGRVSMLQADVTFTIHCDSTRPHFYLGRLVGTGRRDLIEKFNLKRRDYLGTTSMDAELSLLMANLGLVDRGTLVYDPFVGTGSLLCTSAIFGGLCLGSDIDGRQMRGKEACRNMVGNMQQYQVQDRLIDGLVFDFLHHPWRHAFQCDAIITDPPYGVRAGAKTIGTKFVSPPPHSASLSPLEKADRYPKTIPYQMDDLARDLHQFARDFLKPGGRLVYWFPVELDESETRLDRQGLLTLLPSLSGIQLVAAMPQRCRMFDRWLLVYQKQ